MSHGDTGIQEQMADWPQGCMPGTDFANSMLANRRSMVSRKFDTVECCSVIGLPK